MMDRKGQVSIFIIVGILIVLIITSFYFFVFNDAGSLFGPPGDVAPIVIYTESCLSDITAEGVLLMSMQGGYIDLPKDLIREKAYIDNGFRVPYWHHKGRNFQPSTSAMQDELASYIDQRLPECLAFYMPFAQTHDITFKEFPKSEVKIDDKRVRVKTIYPLEIQKKSSETAYSWDEFHVDIDTQLGRMYSLASDLNEHENNNFFLEDYTDEMIAASDYLPFEGLEISCKPSYFFEPNLKEYTKTLLMHNMNFFQFLNTNYHEIDIPYYDKLYKVDFTSKNYKDMNAKVMYDPDWDMDFEAVPSKNGVVKPHEFKPFNYLNTCLKVWHVRYNLEFPVLMQVTQPKTEEAFLFATPVMMRHNEPNRYNEIEPWDIEIEDESANSAYCMNSTEVWDYSLGPDGLMMSRQYDFDNRQNMLRVYTIDGLYGYPEGVLSSVNISYQCVRFRCDMGQTGFDELYDGMVITDALPKLKTGFPECSNGIIIAEKEGYHRALMHQTVSPETSGEQVTVEMFQLKPFDFTVRVVEEHNGIISDRDLRNNESVLISISNDELEFERTLVYPGEQNMFNNLSLLLGSGFDYDIEIYMTYRDTLVGGAEMGWQPSLDNLINSRHVVFYVYKKDPIYAVSSEEEMFELFQESLELSKNYEPRFM